MTISPNRAGHGLLNVLLFLGAAATAIPYATATANPSATANPQEKRPTEAEIGKVQVYLTPETALREIFENTASVDTLHAVLDEKELSALRDLLGHGIPSDSVVIYKPRAKDGSLLGYAVVAEEIGKYRPITFMVGTDSALMIKNVEVLVYRESRGGDVRRGRFLRQYRGKHAADPLRTNKDILNIAGATLSVTALNRGVKRVLNTLQTLAERNAL